MYKKETIGKMIEVTNARNESIIGVEGTVLDETQNTFVVDTEKGEKMIMKKGATFTINDQKVRGDDLLARPEERIKG